MFSGRAHPPSTMESPAESLSSRLSFEEKERYSTIINSGSHLEKEEISSSADVSAPRNDSVQPQRRHSRIVVPLLLIGSLLLAVAIGVPIGLAAFKANHPNARLEHDAPTNGTNGILTNSTHAGPITGGDGSTVTLEDGSTFVYSNSFGGFWVLDPDNPTNDSARPNSWTPPLNQSWNFNRDKIYGVNLGGLFVLEPFISPALYQKYEGAVDEWTLSTMMAADTAGGGLDQLEEHYKTFITEQDIAEIAGAGLNWVRVPIPFWAIDTWPGEPFLERTSWRYIVRLLGWCRKYGIRVNIDLHTIPGSQNGYNHSGRSGPINFMRGVMGLANAQRALNYIRIITEFISQPEWKNVVPYFGILNEPIMPMIGVNQLQSFYAEVHRMVRNITGYGAGNGPYIGIHDGFAGPDPWTGFLRGGDRVILDVHPYFAFGGGPANDPIATGTGAGAGGVWPGRACQSWNNLLSTSRADYGVSVAGEWSTGWNDCGLFLNGVGVAPPTFGGNCEDWQNSANWDDATKAGLMQFALASMDALDSWFFWTWKIGNSTRGIVESPLWSYQLGLREGWIPKDPRAAAGTCANLGMPVTPAPTPYPTWMTGGDGAGLLQNANQFAWPPAEIWGGGAPAQLPQYASTAAVATLPPPSATGSSGKAIDFGSGWYNQQDSSPAPAPIQGCNYPDGWNPAQGAAISPACGPTGMNG